MNRETGHHKRYFLMEDEEKKTQARMPVRN
jgi:hypothetical protein